MVSAEDRRRFERQVAALPTAESDDEGSLEWRHAVIESANEWRAAHGIPPLQTEGELHRRARALGLLD
jgi:hypothetical protein